MKLPKEILLSELLRHNVKGNATLNYGNGENVWMHPPVHRILGWYSRPSNFDLKRNVWKLNQISQIIDNDIFVKGDPAISDLATLNRFPNLIEASLVNSEGSKIGVIADFLFEMKTGNIKFYLISRSNPRIPGSSRWKLNIENIVDQQPGLVFCSCVSLDDFPLIKSSIKHEFFKKGKKIIDRFDDLKNTATNRLEDWLEEDEDINQKSEFNRNSFYNKDEEICKRLGRKPNRTELGMFGVMWSEHCCYRNSKPLLANFPTTGKNVLVGPGENAGVIDVGNNQKLVFKIESHNHPSAIEPFQGAATGVGGILRDIFTMGARPIAVLNSLRFGNLDKSSNISLLRGVVAGISHYGNCVGVPTVGGEIDFDDSYSGNPLVNVMALGLLETDDIVCSGAKDVGSPVLYVGNTTGKDGVGGASFASSELTTNSLDNRPAVQVGDPFIEKSLIEACLDAFKTGDVLAAQDMGAAGLTCSSAEMAANGGLGISINLDLVPARENDMSAYQYLLSESQERMLLVVKEEKLNSLIKQFKKWGLFANVIGQVISKKEVIISQKNQIVAQIPTSALSDETPINIHNVIKQPPNYLKKKWEWSEDQLPNISENKILSLKDKNKYSFSEIILKLLSNPSIASKGWVYRQYDSQVQSNTVFKPGEADAALIRLRGQDDKNKNNKFSGVAASVDCNSRWVLLDPYRGSIAAVVESARNVSCVGAEPIAITNNLNFSSPDTEIGYWQLASACDGISKACIALETPVTGGNVSLYNESKNQNNEITPINPTPVIGMVGTIKNVDKAISLGWKNINDQIWIIGSNASESSIGASSYLEYFHGLVTGRPPKIHLEDEKYCQSFLRNAILKNYIASSHDVSDGGLAVALSECCILSSKGANIQLEEKNARIDSLLFSEGGSRIIFSLKKNEESNFLNFIKINSKDFGRNIYVKKIGFVTEENLDINFQEKTLCKLRVEELTEKFNNSISSCF